MVQMCETLARTLWGFKGYTDWHVALEPGYLESSRSRCCKFAHALPPELVQAVRASQVRRHDITLYVLIRASLNLRCFNIR